MLVLAAVAAAIGVACLALPVEARPPYRQSLKKVYGNRLAAAVHQCATCHLTREEADAPEEFDPEYPPHNMFGERLRILGEQALGGGNSGRPLDIAARLKQIADEDTDGDGVANEVEILAGLHPGRGSQVPAGDVLAAALAAQTAWRAETTGYAWEPFQTVQRPPVPSSVEVTDQAWIRTPIDRFVARAHQQKRLSAAPPAPPHVLLRRVYLDLIGLPPTGEQVRAFLADPSPDAYEREVDRLLASPQYGQRWGRHWMDIWRYSDWAGWTDGKQIRDSQPHIWRWRDWIVESLNADRPYDEMLCSMLAADELTPTDPDELRATGFLVRNFKLLSREKWIDDTIEHTAKAFLGLTLNCARCHDHMYDPLTQEEYYRFRAIFEPHQVRADRVPGEADPTVDGIARVFDAEPQAVTYLYVRGDDRHPDKNRPQSALPPSMLGGEWTLKPVSLPLNAYYPGIQSHVRTSLLKAAESHVAAARGQWEEAELAKSKASALAQATSATDADRLASAKTERDFRLAASRLAAAEAQRASTMARLEADHAKYDEAEHPQALDLARAAVRAERNAAVAQAALELQIAENVLADWQAKVAAGDPDAPRRIQGATEKRDAAAKTLTEALAAQAKTDGDYSPLVEKYPKESSGRRAALAHWLTSRDQPLSARVAVNHIWNRHFGRGLVETVFDFGQNGKPPSHPALLDWLAAEFMEPTWGAASGPPQDHPCAPWSMKHIHRLIVTSGVYRMASQVDTAHRELDPENLAYTRMTPKRMEAELVRDSVLYVAGNLDLSAGGADIDHAQGFAVPRRSLYFRQAAEKQMTFLKIFDVAAVTECYQRKSSIMPQQALAMANSELTITQARRLARAWEHRPCSSPEEFVAAAFEHVLARPVTQAECDMCVQFLHDRTTVVRQPTAGQELKLEVLELKVPVADPESRARESLLHVLLNHHDFVTIH